jgi:hypothetical protein
LFLFCLLFCWFCCCFATVVFNVMVADFCHLDSSCLLPLIVSSSRILWRLYEDMMYLRQSNDILIGEDTRPTSAEIWCRRVELFLSASFISRVFVSSPHYAKGEDTMIDQFIVSSTFGAKTRGHHEDLTNWSIIVSTNIRGQYESFFSCRHEHFSRV